MQIPSNKQEKSNRWQLQKRVVLIALVLCLGLGGFTLKVLYKTSPDAASAIDKLSSPSTLLDIIQADPVIIDLDIKHTHLQKLRVASETAQKTGLLFATNDDLVPAKLRVGEETLSCRVRLKGDAASHVVDKQWSFRVKTKGDDTLFGMKKFSLQKPIARNYINEWLYHQALKQEEFAALRYKFVGLRVNGDSWGIYALEEHFEKQLLESNQRREGPIVRWRDQVFWEEISDQRISSNEAWGPNQYKAGLTDAHGISKYMDTPERTELMASALALLDGYRLGKLSPEQVFDYPRMALFFALCDLMGAEHSKEFFNMKFYYNPVTARLEPVGYDGNAGQRLGVVLIGNQLVRTSLANRDWANRLFADFNFITLLTQAIEKVSHPTYLDEFFASLEEELDTNLSLLYRDDLRYSFSKDVFYQNASQLRASLVPQFPAYAHLNSVESERLNLTVSNPQALPIEVFAISDGKKKPMPLDHPFVVAGRPLTEHTTSATRDVLLSRMLDRDKLTLHVRVLGASQSLTVPVIDFPIHTVSVITEALAQAKPASLDSFPFIRINESLKDIAILPGEWTLTEPLIIPQGYLCRMKEGTHLKLTNHAFILSHSTVEWLGSEEEPITISSDGTGQGVAVIGASDESTVERVVFQGLSNPSTPGWHLTGAVTFYESPVRFSHTQFLNKISEDALNTMRCNFTLDHCLFSGAASDAFDADFCTGLIVDSAFIDSGNDAIDVSGSRVVVERVNISGVGDKALSAGEASHIKARDLLISDAEIAITSKDLSTVVVEGGSVRDCQVGFTIFQKKPEFGPASATATGVEVTNATVVDLVELRSSLILNGIEKQGDVSKVSDLLYGGTYGKKSRPVTQ